MPRKNLRLPLVAASSTARRCFSRFRMGRQKEWGCRPPCHTRKQCHGIAGVAAGRPATYASSVKALLVGLRAAGCPATCKQRQSIASEAGGHPATCKQRQGLAPAAVAHNLQV